MQKVRDKYLGETVLTEKHLYRLMDGLKSYITEQSMNVVESTVRQLKEELDFDSAAINQLQFAIYLFQVICLIITQNLIIFYSNPFAGISQ